MELILSLLDSFFFSLSPIHPPYCLLPLSFKKIVSSFKGLFAYKMIYSNTSLGGWIRNQPFMALGPNLVHHLALKIVLLEYSHTLV